LWKSGALIAVALMAVTCGQRFAKDDFSPTSPSVVDALQLAPARQSIPADGFSAATVTATLSAESALKFRTVVFTTTRGTIVGASGDGLTLERSVEVSTRTATVQVQSSRTVETTRVTATVKDVEGLGREVLIDFAPPVASDILRVTAGADSAPADGATLVPITAEISGALPAARRTVTFTTTAGLFVGNPAVSDGSATSTIKQDADSSNHTTVYLRSPSDRIGTAFVTALVDSEPAYSASTSVQFVRAAAKQMTITLDKAAVANDETSSVGITVSLIREPGVPTQGVVVTFEGVDSAGRTRGLFTSVSRSDATGDVKATFTPGTEAALGPLRIRASADGLTASATVQIISP